MAAALATAQTEHASINGTPIPEGSTPTLDAVPPNQLVARTVAELAFEQARLQGLVGLDAKRAAALTQLQTQLTNARATAGKLDQDIADAEAAQAKIDELTARRTDHYKAYFNALLTEESELRDLYAPLETILKNFGPSVAKLKLSVRRRVDIAGWVGRADRNLIDQRTAGPFKGGGLGAIAETALLAVWETGDGEAASKAIQAFSAEHSKSLRDQAPTETKSDDAAYREWEREVARWLYDVGHIKIAYSLDYDGLNVERLSPGSRGIVLLLLYLAVDQSETDPLIIDQPE